MRVGSMAVGHLPGVHLVLRLGFAARLATCCGERDLRPEHGRQTNGARCLGETHDAVEPVVVGERQRLQAQARRLLRQRLGV